MSNQPPIAPELRDLLGSYSRLVATAMEGVQVVSAHILEAFESGDTDYARELTGVLDENVGFWRATFKL
jgi:hypothetical protein